MYTLFLVCLVGGLVSTVLFAALGTLGGALGHLHTGTGGAHLHVHGGAGHATGQLHGGSGQLTIAHGHAVAGHGPQHGPQHGPAVAGAQASALVAIAGWTLSWFSPLSLAAAALWFGGAGLIAEPSLGALALPVAILAALIGAGLVRALMAALLRSSTPPLQERAEGALGLINAAIRPDAAGEVTYTLEGLQRSAPARSLDGAPLPRGTRVVIVRRERGIALVSPVDPLAVLDGAGQTPEPAQGISPDLPVGPR